MEQSYVNEVIGNTSEFCDIFNNYEDKLKELGEKCDSISKEVENYNSSVATNGNASEQSYDALDDDRKYHDENGEVIPYGLLSETQKRGLAKDAMFVADREIELKDMMAEASYEMHQSAHKFLKDLQDKLVDIRRSNSRLSALNLQYVADMARNQNVIDDCLYQATKVTTVDEKRDIANRRIQALKDNRKTELTFRINTALINATNLIQSTFNQVIISMEDNIKNEFENVDTISAGLMEDKIDILSDLSKLMASFTKLKNEYQTEKELINSINEKCKAMKKATEDKDIKKFANCVMKTTKEFSNLIEDVQKYNDEQKVANDGPENNGPENDGPENDGPENNGPENNGPENDGPENNGPENNEPENDGPENNGPENNGPENNGPENNGPENNGPENDGPENDGPENNGPENDGPENNGPENDGPENDEPEDVVRQNQDVEYKVNRRRQADAAKRNLAMAALGVGLVAANGLGFGVIAGPVLSGGILAVAGLGIASGGMTIWKQKAATRKLKKIAREMQEEGLNIQLGEFDYDKGIVEFMLETEDGQKIPLRDADQDPRLIQALQDKLNKSFRNEQRGLGSNANTKFEIDMQDMPKVTINNLEAAYAPIGGIRAIKDYALSEAFSWDTSSSLIAKIKDSKFVKNLRDREEHPVDEAELEDIIDEPIVVEGEELAEEEVTPEVEEEVTPEVEEEIIDEEPVVETPEETPEQEAPIVETPEETPEQEEQVVETPEVQNAAFESGQEDEEDLFAELEDPSANMDLDDEELAALLADLGNADNLEQGADEIARAAEEEAPSRRL